MNLSVAVFLLEEIEEHDEIPRRTLRDRSNVLEMPTKQFVGNFRVFKDIFLGILGTLKDKWPLAFRSTTIKPEIKLATFLRFVATGSYQQTMGNEHISSTSQSSAGRIIRECLQLFEEWVCPQWIKLPAAEEISNIMEAFFQSGGFPGVIGCADGTHIRIKSPRNDVKRLYYNRKGYYSINAMAVCDHKKRIRYIDARHPGANHDSFIWEQRALDQILQNAFNNGKRNSWILGDAGYKLKPFLMTPFRNPTDAAERQYNKQHASARNVVERCFGLLKNRFRCIIGSRGLHYEPARVTQIINACCALHNMCIQYKFSDGPLDIANIPEENPLNEERREEELEPRAVAIRRRIAINL